MKTFYKNMGKEEKWQKSLSVARQNEQCTKLTRKQIKLAQPDKYPELVHAYQKVLYVVDNAGMRTRFPKQTRIPKIACWKRKYRKLPESQIYKTWGVPEKKTPQSNGYLWRISTDGSNHINPRQSEPDTCRCRGVNVVTRCLFRFLFLSLSQFEFRNLLTRGNSEVEPDHFANDLYGYLPRSLPEFIPEPNPTRMAKRV